MILISKQSSWGLTEITAVMIFFHNINLAIIFTELFYPTVLFQCFTDLKNLRNVGPDPRSFSLLNRDPEGNIEKLRQKKCKEMCNNCNFIHIFKVNIYF